jgi:hypothetical protein
MGYDLLIMYGKSLASRQEISDNLFYLQGGMADSRWKEQ